MTQDTQSELDFYSNNRDPLYNEEIVRGEISLFGLKPGSLILDAGCGDGYWARTLAGYGYKTVGLDLSGDSLNQARKKASKGQKFVKGNLLHNLPFKRGTFDGIVCGGILHHFPAREDLEIVLKNLSSCLKNKGRGLVVEPNGSNPVISLSRLLGRRLVNYYPHIATKNETVHSINTYLKTFKNCGFDVVCLKTFHHHTNGIIKIRDFYSFMIGTRRVMQNLVWKILPEKYGGNELVFIIQKK